MNKQEQMLCEQVRADIRQLLLDRLYPVPLLGHSWGGPLPTEQEEHDYQAKLKQWQQLATVVLNILDADCKFEWEH